ncbi:MAG: TraR/DksA family transcriptional regulator [Nitrospirae bacterium]|nr:TraR/DksA family transcriptional regulator [Nitrospirota bacterium]
MDRKERLRKILLEKRQEVLDEAKREIGKFIRGENRQLVETALDDGDWSVADLNEDLNLKKLTSHKETLNKIDEALRKLEEGTYGICEECGVEIPEERLKIIPFAIYCVDCMERIEQMEEMEKEDLF